MNARTLATTALLLFVAAAVVAVIVRERSGTTEPQSDAQDQVQKGNQVVAWYLHGNKRCPTCRKIESTARAAMDKAFSEALASGELAWCVANYDKPGNEHLMEDYEIASPSVVLVHEDQGRRQRWENLDRVWELVGDQTAFEEYVIAKTRSFLEAGR